MKHFKLTRGNDKLVKTTDSNPAPSFGQEWQKAEELIRGLPEKLDIFYTAQEHYQQADTEDICRVNLLLNEVHRLLDGIHDRH